MHDHGDSRRPQLTYTLTYPPPQQRSQSVAVRIPNLLSNALDGEFAGPEQMDGALDPQILNVLDGRFTEHRVQTPRQRPLAGRQFIGHDVE
jgi:hypothetical protein